MTSADGSVVRFGVDDLPEQLQAFAQRYPDAVADRRGLTFVAGAARLRPPLLAPRPRVGQPVVSYLERLAVDARPGDAERHLVLLLRAGAAAVGYWEGDELLDHKALAAYVVRGNGKAQPTYLASRGKSRYGSRLRLQNWRRLLTDVSERLRRCEEQFGAPERIFLGMPVRLLAELWSADPAPPFAHDDARVQRLPLHVFRPDFAELQRVRAWMATGALELPD
ncbi:MAG: hypothetical protein H6838_09595 [Planctomycetes bacterium]|nr:hypothetical protein [Planctomycetota bacterium]MCB9885735.1 hypothetical protein [Planctomycetota bacterium]